MKPNRHRLPTASRDIFPSNRLIRDVTKTNRIKDLVSTLWGFPKRIEYNPSPNPVSLERRDLHLLKENRYVVSEKSDGVRYMILLGLMNPKDESTAFCVMIDRRYRIYEIQIAASSEYFEGSLFDGELVWENDPNSTSPRQIFLIFDIMALKGNLLIKQKNYIERFKKINDLFHLNDKDVTEDPSTWTITASKLAENGKIVCIGNSFLLAFRPKTCFAKEHLPSLWRNLHRLNHLCDGLIWTPIDQPVRTGTNIHMLKWKWNNTIDLTLKARLTDTGWENTVFFQDNQKGEASCADTPLAFRSKKALLIHHTSEVLSSFLASYTGTTMCIVECQCIMPEVMFQNGFQLSPEGYLPIGVSVIAMRPDKPHGNNRKTIERTLVNIDEKITFEDFLITVPKVVGTNNTDEIKTENIEIQGHTPISIPSSTVVSTPNGIQLQSSKNTENVNSNVLDTIDVRSLFG